MREAAKFYIETYGCQMNIADSEIVATVMAGQNYKITEDITEADALFINTCSIRDNAEQRVMGRLDVFRQEKLKRKNVIIGILGCMAQRMANELFEKCEFLDIVAGPDSYNHLPFLITQAQEGKKSIDVDLSTTETYSEISPDRLNPEGISTFVPIMRGCDNFCSYCIVPYTRGRERSRDLESIIHDIAQVTSEGYKEVSLLGQNVNSYSYTPEGENAEPIKFPKLLETLAKKFRDTWFRFTTSNPKDLSDELLQVMSRNRNICKHIHLPLQSGSTRILQAMNRKYTREWYMDRIKAIRKHIPDCSITTDVFVGFCGEEQEDHMETISLMEWAKFDFAYMFKYSERPGTYAHKHLDDNVPEGVKTKRLQEIIDLQQELSAQSNKRDINQIFDAIVEGVSKKSDEMLSARTSQNKVVVFPRKNHEKGDHVKVLITDCTSATLIGKSID